MSIPLHPKLVHIPIALAVLMPIITAGLAVAWWRGWLPRRSWLVAIALQGVLVGAGVAALQTGEADEEVVEAVVPESAIEAHEEAAGAMVWASAAVLVVMIAAPLLPGRSIRAAVAISAIIGTLVVLGLGYRTGEAGGALVYQHGAASAHGAGTAPVVRQHDDDD